MVKSILFCVATILFLGACSTSSSETKSNAADTVKADAKKADTLSRAEVTALYSQAIAEYIKSAYKKEKVAPDTLFLMKNVEFPEITIPATIRKIPVRLLSALDAEKKMKQQKSWVMLNVVGWPEKNKAEFVIVTFLDGGKPQHNCRINFTRHPEKKEFELDSLNFYYLYSR